MTFRLGFRNYFVLLSLFTGSTLPSIADDNDKNVKVGIYHSCWKACFKNQTALPGNKSFADMPFVFDAYCACHCTRTVLRMEQMDMAEVARGMFEGKSLEQLPGIKKLVGRNIEICTEMLVKN